MFFLPPWSSAPYILVLDTYRILPHTQRVLLIDHLRLRIVPRIFTSPLSSVTKDDQISLNCMTGQALMSAQCFQRLQGIICRNGPFLRRYWAKSLCGVSHPFCYL